MFVKEFDRGQTDTGYHVEQTSDGGFIVVGTTFISEMSDSDIWMLKIDNKGNKEWDKTFGGDWSDSGKGIIQTNDGGYMLLGETGATNKSSDIWLIKTDKDGNELWNRVFGGNDPEGAESIFPTTDGGYIILGDTESFGNGFTDIWLIKIYSNGNEAWNKTIGGKNFDYGYDIQQTTDGGYVISGETYLEAYDFDLWLIKTDQQGNEIWNKTFGGTESDNGVSVQVNAKGEFIIIGATSSFGSGKLNLWLIKTDQAGNEIWNKTFGDADSISWGSSIKSTSDGEYIICGSIFKGKVIKSYALLYKMNLDDYNREIQNGDGSADSFFKFPWLWIAIGAGAIILLAIIIIIIRRRNDDEWDDEDDEDDEEDDDDDDEDDEDEEEEKVRRKPSKPPQKRCVKCSTILITPDAAFCAACGSSQAAVSAPAPSPQLMNCPGCGGLNTQGTTFCGMCGMNLQQSLGGAPAVPMVQQGNVQQQPVSNQFGQQAQAAAPPMGQQGYMQQAQRNDLLTWKVIWLVKKL